MITDYWLLMVSIPQVPQSVFPCWKWGIGIEFIVDFNVLVDQHRHFVQKSVIHLGNHIYSQFFVLIPSEYVSCIYLLFYIIKALVIAIGDNRLALRLESCNVIDHLTAKER